MSRFPSARHLASWAGMCPGNNESAGKRLSGRTRKGSPWLRTALVEAAHAATHSKDCYLAAQYHRLLIGGEARRPPLPSGTPYLPSSTTSWLMRKTMRNWEATTSTNGIGRRGSQRLVRRLEKLGYEVTLTSTEPAV